MLNALPHTSTQEMSASFMTSVFKDGGKGACFKPGGEGVNNMRRATMVGMQKGAERAGFNPDMHAKRVVNHRAKGHGTRETVYEDTMATTDGMAFMMGRPPQPIESLKSVSSKRVLELSKFQVYEDVLKRDPLQKVRTDSEELQALAAAIARIKKSKGAVVEEAQKAKVEMQMTMLRSEWQNLDTHLKKVVLYKKRNEVYERGLERLETMPLAEVQKLHAVNTYEGISIEHILLRYGCTADLSTYDVFEIEAIEKERVKGKKTEFLVKWRGYTDNHNTWEPASAIEDEAVIKAFKTAERQKALANLVAARQEAHKMLHAAKDPESDSAAAILDRLFELDAEIAAAKQAEDEAAEEEGAEEQAVLAGMTTPSKAKPRQLEALPSPPASVRKAAQREEDAMAVLYHDMVKDPKVKKKHALAELASMAKMSEKTLRKKIERATRRAQMGGVTGGGEVTLNLDGVEHTMTYDAYDVVADLEEHAAHLANKPAASMRLHCDGLRLPRSDLLSAALQSLELSAGEAVLDVSTEVRGGGDGSQDSPVMLSPIIDDGGTDIDEGATEIDEQDAEEVSGTSAIAPLDLDDLDDDALRERLHACLASQVICDR